MRTRHTVCLLLLCTFIACKERTSSADGDANPDRIYFDYAVSGEEERNEVTCLLQFRNGGPEGPTLIMEKPAKVELDGKEIEADSTAITGAYYEVQIPLENFIGQHTITVTDVNNKRYTETFRYTSFSLAEELPDAVQRGDVTLRLQGVQNADQLQLIITDTAYATDDVIATLPVQNGRVVINQQLWEAVSNGPVIVQITKQEERPVSNGTQAGGRLTLSYSLRREFELVD